MDLLKEDEEFRLAVAGLLGLREILEEVRKLREDFNAFVKEQARRWEENEKRWEENNRRWEEADRRFEAIVRELEALRKDHNTLREDFNSFAREQAKRWEENWKRWEENEERWRENFRRWEENNRRWEENWKRWEENEKRWEENFKRWEETDKKFRWLMSALVDIRDSLGGAFEFYTANVVRALLSERGIVCDVWVNVTLPVDGFREVDLFCPDPLVVGEATTSIRTVEEAEREVGKLLSAVEAAERFTGRKTYLKVLAVETAPMDVVEHLRRRAGELGIHLITGREY